MKMLEFFIDSIFVIFDRRFCQQTIGIPLGTPLPADLLRYLYRASQQKRKEASIA